MIIKPATEGIQYALAEQSGHFSGFDTPDIGFVFSITFLHFIHRYSYLGTTTLLQCGSFYAILLPVLRLGLRPIACEDGGPNSFFRIRRLLGIRLRPLIICWRLAARFLPRNPKSFARGLNRFRTVLPTALPALNAGDFFAALRTRLTAFFTAFLNVLPKPILLVPLFGG